MLYVLHSFIYVSAVRFIIFIIRLAYAYVDHFFRLFIVLFLLSLLSLVRIINLRGVTGGAVSFIIGLLLAFCFLWFGDILYLNYYTLVLYVYLLLTNYMENI